MVASFLASAQTDTQIGIAKGAATSEDTMQPARLDEKENHEGCTTQKKALASTAAQTPKETALIHNLPKVIPGIRTISDRSGK